MERKWVLILGRILILLGFVILIANFVFNYLSSVNGTAPGVVTQINALSLLLPGIILVGFNRVLNKLDEQTKDKEVERNYKSNNETQIITKDDQLKDYKYVTRK